jgi:hypothetical protein
MNFESLQKNFKNSAAIDDDEGKVKLQLVISAMLDVVINSEANSL